MKRQDAERGRYVIGKRNEELYEMPQKSIIHVRLSQRGKNGHERKFVEEKHEKTECRKGEDT